MRFFNANERSKGEGQGKKEEGKGRGGKGREEGKEGNLIRKPLSSKNLSEGIRPIC